MAIVPSTCIISRPISRIIVGACHRKKMRASKLIIARHIRHVTSEFGQSKGVKGHVISNRFMRDLAKTCLARARPSHSSEGAERTPDRQKHTIVKNWNGLIRHHTGVEINSYLYPPPPLTLFPGSLAVQRDSLLFFSHSGSIQQLLRCFTSCSDVGRAAPEGS